MDITQAAQSYLDVYPGFNASQGVPTQEMLDASMRALVQTAQRSSFTEGKLDHLNGIIASVAELAPKSAVLFDHRVVDNPEQQPLAKTLEMGLAVLEQQSPETWKHVQNHTALTMSYYERQCEMQNQPMDTNEALTLMIGALMHDIGKAGLDPKLLHKSNRIDPQRFSAAIESYRRNVPDYQASGEDMSADHVSVKEHDIAFLEAANQGKIIFAQKRDKDAYPDALMLHSIQDVGADWSRGESTFMDEEQRQRMNAIMERINAKAQQYLPPESWFTPAENETLAMSERGTLTPMERAVIETHDMMSESFMNAAPLPAPLEGVRQIVSMDRYRNKGGAPEISPPLQNLADIIHATDVYEALTADRSYRKGFSQEKAISIMADDAQKGKLNGAVLQSLVGSGALTAYKPYDPQIAEPVVPQAAPQQPQSITSIIADFLGMDTSVASTGRWQGMVSGRRAQTPVGARGI